MYDVRIIQTIVIVTCALRASTKTDEKDNLQLSKIFCTPKDFSRVNFDHFELLERNNFDPPPTGTSPNNDESTKQQPKSFANAQVMLRIGGDDIKGKNSIECPPKVMNKVGQPYPITHATGIHHQENQIRSSANPFLPYSFVPQINQYSPMSPYLTVAPLAPPFVFPGYMYNSPEFAAPYGYNGMPSSSNNEYECGNFLENTNRERTIANIINVNHPKILHSTDLKNDIVRESRSQHTDINNTDAIVEKGDHTKNTNDPPIVIFQADRREGIQNTAFKMNSLPEETLGNHGLKTEKPIPYKTFTGFDEREAIRPSYNMLYSHNFLLNPLSREIFRDIRPISDDNLFKPTENLGKINEIISIPKIHNEIPIYETESPFSTLNKEDVYVPLTREDLYGATKGKLISVISDKDKKTQFFSHYTLSQIDPPDNKGKCIDSLPIKQDEIRKNPTPSAELKLSEPPMCGETTVSLADSVAAPINMPTLGPETPEPELHCINSAMKDSPLSKHSTKENCIEIQPCKEISKEAPILIPPHEKKSIHSDLPRHSHDCENSIQPCTEPPHSFCDTVIHSTDSLIEKTPASKTVHKKTPIPTATKKHVGKKIPVHPEKKVPVPAKVHSKAPTKTSSSTESCTPARTEQPTSTCDNAPKCEKIPTACEENNLSKDAKAACKDNLSESSSCEETPLDPCETRVPIHEEILNILAAYIPIFKEAIKEECNDSFSLEDCFSISPDGKLTFTSCEEIPCDSDIKSVCEVVDKENPISISGIEETPISITAEKETPIHVGAPIDMGDHKKEAPISISAVDESPISITTIKKEAPIYIPPVIKEAPINIPVTPPDVDACKESSIHITATKESLIPSSLIKGTPISIPAYKETSADIAAFEGCPFSIAATKEEPICISSIKETPISIPSSRESPIELAVHRDVPLFISSEEEPCANDVSSYILAPKKETPISIAAAKEAHIQISSMKETPISIPSSKESPIELTVHRDVPFFISSEEEPCANDCDKVIPVYEETPIAVVNYEEVPISIAPKKETPISITAAKEAHIQISPMKEIPIFISPNEQILKESSLPKVVPIPSKTFDNIIPIYEEALYEECPISIEAIQEYPISMSATKETPIDVDACKEAPISIAATKETPSIKKEAPIYIPPIKKETPISIQAHKEAPIDLSVDEETPKSMICGELPPSSCESIKPVYEEATIDTAVYQECPISIEAIQETPIFMSATKDKPIDVDACKEALITIQAHKEAPIELCLGENAPAVYEECPISIEAIPELPISISATKETPIEVDAYKESPVSIAATKETPISITGIKKEAPILIPPVIKETPISLQTHKEAPIELSVNKETPISITCTELPPFSCESVQPIYQECPISIEAIQETPISISATKETPIDVDACKETPITIQAHKEAPMELYVGKEAPLSIICTDLPVSSCENIKPLYEEVAIETAVYEECPISIEAIQETPISISATKEAPIEVDACKETPISIGAAKETPISIPSIKKEAPIHIPSIKKETPITIQAHKEAPIELSVNEEAPISMVCTELPPSSCESIKPVYEELAIETAVYEECPVSIEAIKETPISISATKEAPIEVDACKETPISIGAAKETTISIPSIKKEAPIHIPPIKKETPITIQAHKGAPIELSVNEEAPISMVCTELPPSSCGSIKPVYEELAIETAVYEECPISIEAIQETPISISATKEAPIEVDAWKETPISIGAAKETPISIPSIKKEAPIHIPPIKKETPITIQAHKEAPIELSVNEEVPISMICTELPPSSCENIQPVYEELAIETAVYEECPISIEAIQETPISISATKEAPIEVDACKETPVSIAATKEKPITIPSIKKETPITIQAHKEAPVVLSVNNSPMSIICTELPPISRESIQPVYEEAAIDTAVYEECPISIEAIQETPISISSTKEAPIEVDTCKEAPVSIAASKEPLISIPSIKKEAPITIQAHKEAPVKLSVDEEAPISITCTDLPYFSCESIKPIYEKVVFDTIYQECPVSIVAIEDTPISLSATKEADINLGATLAISSNTEVPTLNIACQDTSIHKPSCAATLLDEEPLHIYSIIEETPIFIPAFKDSHIELHKDAPSIISNKEEPCLESSASLCNFDKLVHEESSVAVEDCKNTPKKETPISISTIKKETPIELTVHRDVPLFILSTEEACVDDAYKGSSESHSDNIKPVYEETPLVAVDYQNIPISVAPKKETPISIPARKEASGAPLPNNASKESSINIPHSHCDHIKPVCNQTPMDHAAIAVTKEAPISMTAEKETPIDITVHKDTPISITAKKESPIFISSIGEAPISIPAPAPIESIICEETPICMTAVVFEESHIPLATHKEGCNEVPFSITCVDTGVCQETPICVPVETDSSFYLYPAGNGVNKEYHQPQHSCSPCNNQEENLSVEKELPSKVCGQGEKENSICNDWPDFTYPEKPVVVTLNTIEQITVPSHNEMCFVDIVPQIECEKMEEWLNNSLVPYDCKEYGRKFLVSYPISEGIVPEIPKYNVFSGTPICNEKLSGANCPCCQLKGFCDCINCQCGRSTTCPYGKRFSTDVDSLFEIVPSCPQSMGYKIKSPHKSPSHSKLSLPLPYSTGYSTSYKSTSLSGYLKVGEEVVYNGLTTVSGGGFYTDSHNHVYYKQPCIKQIVSKPFPTDVELQVNCYQPPKVFSFIPNHHDFTNNNKPSYVPTDNIYYNQLHPYSDKIVSKRKYVASDDTLMVHKDTSCSYS